MKKDANREYFPCKQNEHNAADRPNPGFLHNCAHSSFCRPPIVALILVSICIFTVQIYFNFQEYFEYRTKIEIRQKLELAPFPAVTICNLNAIKLSEAQKFVEKIGNSGVKNNRDISSIVAGMPPEIGQNLSTKLDEFIFYCSFNDKECNLKKEFQIKMDFKFGNCWTFNSNESILMANSCPGPMHGLRLLLNVNQSEYLPTTEAAGVRIVFHSQDQEPFPDIFGHSAPIGFISSFGLKKTTFHRLDVPFGKCSDTFRPKGYIYREKYSFEGCQRNCFQHKIIAECGCGDARFPLPNENAEYRHCDLANQRERNCLANQTNFYKKLTQNCHCLQICTEEKFKTTYSGAVWPAKNYEIGKEKCALILGNTFTKEECKEYYRKNTAMVKIYYAEMGYLKLVEMPKYTLTNLLADFAFNFVVCFAFSFLVMIICGKTVKEKGKEEGI